MAIKVTPLRVIALVLGLLVAVAVSLYALGISPLDKFCRKFVAETAFLPADVHVSTCRANINNGAVERFFTAPVPAGTLQTFMAAVGVPEDTRAAALQSQEIGWQRDGGNASLVWAEGNLTYLFQRN